MNNDLGNFLASHPYAETTRRKYTYILELFLNECDTATVTAPGLVTFVSRPEWGNSNRCVALAACQKFIGWLHGQTHTALSAKLKRIPGRPQRALDPETALKLLASFDRHSPKGARDLALCTLALDTGLRCSELCRLQQADTDTLKGVLQVIVKGGQWKAAVFSEQTAAHIEHWKAFRQQNALQGYLFLNVHTGRGLADHGLFNIVRSWGKAIGITLSPHDLRRSFAVLATLNGAPERVLMAGGRWSNSDMIHRYTRTLQLEAMRKYLPVTSLSGIIKETG